MRELLDVYRKKVLGAISGWDRIRFRGTIRWLASQRGIESYLATRHILPKGYGAWAEAITKRVRAACEAQARRLAVPILYLHSLGVDKEAMARCCATASSARKGPR